MKIAIIGSFGTGKTTLLNALKKELPDWNFLPEVATMAFDLGFKLDKDASAETQIWIVAKHLELEKFTKENWISDRCLLDTYAYLVQLYDLSFIELLEPIILKNINYDLILYLPIEFEIEDNGVRSMDEYFQKDIDNELKNILKINDIKYHKITGTAKNRVDKVLKLIKKI